MEAVMFAGIVVVALIAVAVSIIVFTIGVPGHGLVARFRTAWFVFRYDNALEWLGVPSARRKGELNELRANMGAALTERPLPEVLEAVGDPRLLALNVEGGRRGPRWGLGAAVAVACAVGGILLGALAADVFAAAAQAASTEPGVVSGSSRLVPGMTFEAQIGHGGTLEGLGLTVGPVLSLIVPLLVGLLVAAPWRAIRRGER